MNLSCPGTPRVRPTFLGNFTPETSNYCLKNSALGFPRCYYFPFSQIFQARFTLCPPGPEDFLLISMRTSDGANVTSLGTEPSPVSVVFERKPQWCSKENLQLLHPGKLTCLETKIEVWKMMTPLKSGDLLGSMLIFRGVYQEMKTMWRNLHSHYVHILNYYTFTNISFTCSQKQLTMSCFLSKTVWYFTLPETNMNLKMDGWNTSTLLGWPIFGGELLVSGSVKSPYPINSSNNTSTQALLLRPPAATPLPRWRFASVPCAPSQEYVAPDGRQTHGVTNQRAHPDRSAWSTYHTYHTHPVPNVRHHLPRKKTPAFFQKGLLKYWVFP